MNEVEVRREFVRQLNENRANGSTRIPSTDKVLMKTGGSKRDVNRFLQHIRGIMAERITPRRASTTRSDRMRSNSAGSELVVCGSDRMTTLGVADDDLNRLPRTTGKRIAKKRWKDPTK